MATLLEQYRSKLVTADKAVKSIKTGDTVHYGAFCGAVWDLDQALAARVDELEDVKTITTIWPYSEPPAIVKADPEAKRFKFNSTQFGAVERKMNRQGSCWYIPVQFREQLKYFTQDVDLDVAMLRVAPMDKHGYFNLGPQVADAPAIVNNAKTVIVEVNEKMPVVHGMQNAIHISQIDFIVQGSNLELPVSIGKKLLKWIARSLLTL